MWYQSYPLQEEYIQLPFYATGIGKHDCQYPVYRPDGLGRHQFLYAAHGEGILKIQGESILLPERSGFYIPAGMPHEYYSEGDIWDVRWLSCGGSGVEGLCEHFQIRPGKPYKLSETKPLDDILDKMHLTGMKESSSRLYLLFSQINEFIVTFCMLAGILPEHHDQNTDMYAIHISLLQNYIEQNYMTEIRMDELCRLISVTPQHLCRIFKKTLGKRPVAYINEVRLEHMKEYLAREDYTVAQLAERCGFQSSGYMGRLFKKETGMTPGEYRLKNLHSM